MIPFIDLAAQQARIRDRIDQRIKTVLDHGKYILGPENAELEGQLAAFTGVKHALGVASGTDALVMALMALEIGPGDEVITPAFTFVATAEAIRMVGATPVFVDVEPDTYNIDVALVPDLITPNTKAIIAVDLFGQCADYTALDIVCKKYNLFLIEDGAQGFGAEQNGQRACSFGDIATTSFFPAKPLGGYGDGGACFTNDDALAEKLTHIRMHGQSGYYEYACVGLNGRLDTIQSAILLEKLAIFEEEVGLRQQVAEAYNTALCGVVTTPVVRPGNICVYAQYTMQVDDRDGVQKRLGEQDVPSAVYYPHPLHKQAPYASDANLPVTDAISERVLSLPMHPYLTAADQEKICAAVISAVE